MIPLTLQTLCSTLHDILSESASPVERDIAFMLSRVDYDQAAAFRLKRYQRKIDVARRVMTAYDDSIDKATGTDMLSNDGYLGLALVFVRAAWHDAGPDETSRARLLRWTNSASNCLDHANPARAQEISRAFDTALQSLLHKGAAH